MKIVLFGLLLFNQAWTEPTTDLPSSARNLLSNFEDSKTTQDVVDYLKKRKSELVGTTKSEGQFGAHRALLPVGHSETVFSIAESGSAEMVVDTDSAEGLKPFLLKKGASGKGLDAVPSEFCASCHTHDFTYIWRLSFEQRFTANRLTNGHFKDFPELSGSIGDRREDLNSELAQRAARSLYYKIKSRNPDRFAKHFKDLVQLLLNCGDQESIWNNVLSSIKKDAPKLYKTWKTIEEDKTQNWESNSIRPLMLIHYLGVPPQNIFLFRPIDSDEDVFKSPKIFFDLLCDFGGKRFGPLAAYGGSNDDIRGYLLHHLLKRFLPETQLHSYDGSNKKAGDWDLSVRPTPPRDPKSNDEKSSNNIAIELDVYSLYFDFENRQQEKANVVTKKNTENVLCESVRKSPLEPKEILHQLSTSSTESLSIQEHIRK